MLHWLEIISIKNILASILSHLRLLCHYFKQKCQNFGINGRLGSPKLNFLETHLNHSDSGIFQLQDPTKIISLPLLVLEKMPILLGHRQSLAPYCFRLAIYGVFFFASRFLSRQKSQRPNSFSIKSGSSCRCSEMGSFFEF